VWFRDAKNAGDAQFREVVEELPGIAGHHHQHLLGA
jgi:hypothetical protein